MERKWSKESMEYAIKTANDDAFKEGVIFAIKTLRDLKESDLKDWSHSRSIQFAPVELSDYILIKYKRECL